MQFRITCSPALAITLFCWSAVVTRGLDGLPETIGSGAAPVRLVRTLVLDRTDGGSRVESLQADVAHTHKLGGDSVAITTTLTNRTQQLRCLEVQYHFRLDEDAESRVFTAGEGSFAEFPDRGTLVAQYLAGWFGKKLVIPLGTVYSRERGFTACAELVTPIPSFVFTTTRSAAGIELTVTRPRLRLDPAGAARVTTHFLTHAGDWRPGLDFARRHWPELFYVRDGAEILQVRGNGGGGLASYYAYNGLDEKFWQTYGMKGSPWGDGLAVPYLFAWFGNYYYDETDGGFVPRVMTKWHDIHAHPEHYPAAFLAGKPAEDADWREIVAWLASREVDEELFQTFRHTAGMPVGAQMWAKVSHAQVRRYLALAREYGPVTMAYWNPSEVWDNWAVDMFKDYLVPDWHNYLDCGLANIHPGSPVERIYWEKAKAIIDNYPNLTGLHVDQAFYGWTDRRHDDGFSVDEHGAFSDLYRNIGRFVRRVTEYAHAHGKYTDQNHPQAAIEVTGWSDLACVEDRCAWDVGQEFGRYVTVGNRGCIQLYPDELRMQTNVRNGWFTNMGIDDAAYLDTSPRSTSHWLSRLYPPLFDLYRGREWVLEPNCLELPDGYAGNLFRRPDGNYVATLLARGERTTTAYWRAAVPVRVRFAAAAAVKGVYLLSADRLGPRKLDFSRDGTDIRVVLPRHKSVSALLFAVTGRFVSLEHDSFRVGRQQRVSVLSDNFTDDPWSFDALVAYPGNNCKLRAQIGPGQTGRTWFYANHPRTGASAHGFFRFRLHLDPGVVIPMPEEKARHIATFEIADENSVGFWVAPSLPLLRRMQSNSTQGGYRPYWNAFPLHVFENERAQFEVGLVNNTDEDMRVGLSYTGSNVNVVDAPGTVTLAARGAVSVPVTVLGAGAGAGELAVVIQAPGTNTTRRCTFQVFGTAATAANLTNIAAVSLIIDLWGRTDTSKRKPVFLNGTEVGVLEGAFNGYSVWSQRVRTELSAAALPVLEPANTVRIENPARDSFKIRRAMLEVKTDDDRTFLLRAAPEPISTAQTEVWEDNQPHAVEWLFAEGERVDLGEPLIITFPAP